MPNQIWVTDITYIQTLEGWRYLAVVRDLFSRQVIGWSMQSRMESDLALNVLLMAVWRLQPQATVTIHSDQGSQFSSMKWQSFDNAVAESFFQLLKRECVRRKSYIDQEEARRDILDYIELFYNPERRHNYTDGLFPVEFEKQYFKRLESVY